MVSPQFGLSRWVVGDDICSCGQDEEGQEKLWGGKVVTRRSETAGFAFCMKGRNKRQTKWQTFTVIKRMIQFLSSDLENHRQTLRPLSVFTVGLCIQISWRARTACCQAMCRPHICITLIKQKVIFFYLIIVCIIWTQNDINSNQIHSLPVW